MGQVISFLALMWVLYIVGGGLLLLIGWICTNWYRFMTAVYVIMFFVIHIQSAPDVDPPSKYSYPAYRSEPAPEPTGPIYVTRIYGRPSIEERITLEECRLLPGYRGVVYGLCTSDESYAAYYE